MTQLLTSSELWIEAIGVVLTGFLGCLGWTFASWLLSGFASFRRPKA